MCLLPLRILSMLGICTLLFLPLFRQEKATGLGGLQSGLNGLLQFFDSFVCPCLLSLQYGDARSVEGFAFLQVRYDLCLGSLDED